MNPLRDQRSAARDPGEIRHGAARGVFPGVEPAALDGDAYFVVESLDELERRWPDVLETRPDFVKIMIEYSEEYASRRDDPSYFGRSGAKWTAWKKNVWRFCRKSSGSLKDVRPLNRS